LTGPPGWSWDPDADQPATLELDSIAERLQRQGLQVDPLVRHGFQADLGHDLCSIGAARNVDLIVMSTRGQGGLGRWLYGSTADQVLRTTAVPLLVIPASCSRAWATPHPRAAGWLGARQAGARSSPGCCRFAGRRAPAGVGLQPARCGAAWN
jgi:hypothetical protein